MPKVNVRRIQDKQLMAMSRQHAIVLDLLPEIEISLSKSE